MHNKTIKRKLILKNEIKIIFLKVLLTTIIFLVGMILIKQNPSNKVLITKNIFEKTIKFSKTREIYQKYFGDIFTIDKITYSEVPVWNETISYNKKNKYLDGVELQVENKYMVPALESGIIIFIGEKENYGETIIIEQTNGIDVFYSNITKNNFKLYDYVEKGTYLGETKDDKLYLIFQKNGEVLNYKDYI